MEGGECLRTLRVKTVQRKLILEEHLSLNIKWFNAGFTVALLLKSKSKKYM
jgi:hypothetical protein